MRVAAIALMIFVFFFVYHTQVVRKMYEEMARRQMRIYVYDHQAFMAKTRDQAKTVILAGGSIDPEGFYGEQQRRLRAKFAALPANTIVIRSDAVIQGGRDVLAEK